MKEEISVDHLRSILSYDFYSGVMIWKWNDNRSKGWNKRYAGEKAGSISGCGYRLININGRNRVSIRSDNKSGVTGVHWSKKSGKWESSIKINGKGIFLGYFEDIEMAASARREAEEKYFGEFSRK